MSRVARRSANRIFHLDTQLFRDLPLTVFTSADMDERAVLLPTRTNADHMKRGERPTLLKCIPQVALAIASTACACLIVVILLIVVLGYSRVNATMQNIDSAVGLHEATIGMIGNAKSILNSTAKIADVVHTLGLHGLDARVFAKPFLTRLLNTSTLIADDLHTVLEHPRISIG